MIKQIDHLAIVVTDLGDSSYREGAKSASFGF